MLVHLHEHGYPGNITSVTDPYGRSAHFQYGNDGMLTNIIDTAGMPSSFKYDQHFWMTNMVTPYGTNKFRYFDAETAAPQTVQLDRAIEVTEADGSKQLYAYRDHGSVTNAGVTIPLSGWFASNDPQYYDRNSYHWDRKQFALISATGLANYLDMPKEDYWKASVKHWLMEELVGYTMISDTPSDMAGPVLHPQTDDTRSGQVHFSYVSSSSTFVGSMRRVTEIIKGNVTSWSPPDTTGLSISRNSWGRPTSITYYNSLGNATYNNTYDDDGRILQTVTGPQSEYVRRYGYDSVKTNLLIAVTNVLGEVIRYTHDASNRVTSIRYPSGLITTNFYYTSGISTGFLAKTIDIGFRTNSFSYTNGNVYIHTNELGLVTTNLWDKLDRPLATHYPEGYTSNHWDKLDIVGRRDRMGFWTRYVYNRVRQLVAVTNANGAVTEYEYCGCGSPSQIKAWNGGTSLITTFDYDLAGQLTTATYPDSYQLNYSYDDLERILTVLDSGGHRVEFGYNDFDQISEVKLGSGANQRHLVSRQFDSYGRLTSSTDRNGVTTVNTYDGLDRLLERNTTGGSTASGTEYFEYDARGLTNYTDALGEVTRSVRDELGRTLFETNANLELLQFTYNPSGQLWTLTDGKAQTTRWKYDQEGRVTNKVDAASADMFRYQYDANARLTNRWQAGSITTTFRYDAVGNLTNVVYPTSSNIVLRYDALNRLTNLTDGVGTTAFSWTAANQLASEDGPWADDTVSYSYTNRQRSSLSVQQPNASPWTQSYAYDLYRRLTNVTSPAGAFGTQYKPVSAGSVDWAADLVARRDLPNGSYIENEQDDLSRLLSTALRKADTSLLNSHAYEYNAGHQRTKQTFTTGSYADYTYDNIGQVTLADSSVNSEDRGYAYDAAWNLTNRVRNGTSDSFAVDSRNQLTSEPAGSCTYDARGNLTGDAGKVLVYDDENQLVEWRESSSPTSGAVASTFVYDGLGRLRVRGGYLGNGSSWVFQSAVYYIYDGRNVIQERDGDNLAQVAYTRGTDLSGSLEGAGGIGGLLARSHEFTECGSTLTLNITNVSGYCIYDLTIWDDYGTYVSGATIDNGNIGSYSFTGVAGRTYYVFGWSCDEYYIQVYSDQFTGTLENHNMEFVGEGDYRPNESGNPLCLPGVSGGQWLTHNYYHADGNGNITALESSAETLTASYRYDPFGNTVSQSGGLANANKYRFSSKMIHATSGLYYYGFRFYAPNLQRWLNRDPIEERGGWNLYAFVENRPVNVFDALGLKFVYQGPYADDYKRIIECWKEKLPEKSALREVIKELEESPRDIRITENTLKGGKGKPADPSTGKDLLDAGKGRDTTSYLDPKSYTIGKRTWTFSETLAHELLHASYYQDPNRGPDHHLEDTWDEDEKKVTNDAKGVPCK